MAPACRSRDDDLSSPLSPQLEKLCALIGLWESADPLPEGRRRSVDMVEDFFQGLEGGKNPWSRLLEKAITGEGMGMIIPTTAEDAGNFEKELPLVFDEESIHKHPGFSWNVAKRPRLAERSAADVSASLALPDPHGGPGVLPYQQVEQQACLCWNFS